MEECDRILSSSSFGSTLAEVCGGQESDAARAALAVLGRAMRDPNQAPDAGAEICFEELVRAFCQIASPAAA
jgi:hypothetical protein